MNDLLPVAPLTEMLPAQPVCAADPGSWCAWLYQWTSNDFLASTADVVIGPGIRILFILVIAFVVRFDLHRLVNRLVEGATNGKVSKILGRAPQPRPNTPAPAIRRNQRARTVGSVLRSAISVIVLSIAAFMVMSEFGVNLGPIIASAGIVGVAVGFGAQNLVRDFLSGMFMLLEDQYGVGDIVDLGEAVGTVESVGLRVTTLRDVKGTVWYVRNGEVLRVGNMSQGHAVAVIDVPVAHTADIAEVTALITQVVDDRVRHEDIADDVIEDPDVLGVDKVGPEGVTLRVLVKTAPAKQWAVQRALNGAITDAFDDAGVPRPSLLGLPPAGGVQLQK